MKRAARSMRNGSSLNETSGDSGVLNVRVARSAAPPNGSTRVGVGEVSSSAIALIVKSRRDRSVSISSANSTCGLRESSLYASARCVVISYVRPSFLAPIVPNRSPWVQISVGPPGEASLDVCRASRRGRVEVEVVAFVGDQQIANGSADEVQTVTGSREPLCQWRKLVEDRPKPIRDHNQPCCCQWRSTASTACEPGPADVWRSTSPAARGDPPFDTPASWRITSDEQLAKASRS